MMLFHFYLNLVNRLMFVAYLHKLMISNTPTERSRKERVGWARWPWNVTVSRNRMSEIISTNEICRNSRRVCSGTILLKPNVFSVYFIFLQVREEKILEHSNITLRIHRYCLASNILKQIRPNYSNFWQCILNCYFLTVEWLLVELS